MICKQKKKFIKDNKKNLKRGGSSENSSGILEFKNAGDGENLSMIKPG
jgi:hypothetical protein